MSFHCQQNSYYFQLHTISKMDNQSSDSQHSVEIGLSQTKKPNNRNKFSHKGLCLSSDFCGGNLHAASFQQQFRLEGKIALVVQFWGNSDAQTDPLDKSWFYFTVSGIKESRNMKYQQIIFRFKNANNYRKFIREKRYKPYVLVKQETQKVESSWSTIFISKINILQNQVIQAEFVYSVQPGVDKVTFAQNIPYQLADLDKLHQKNLQFLDTSRNSKVYYHRQIIAYTVDNFPIYLCTITSSQNVMNYDQFQAELWPHKGQRPYLLKNRPQIVITARVHPSETSSSFCVEGIIQSLIKKSQFNVLFDIFIFRIVPMINVDGVQNGHYRLDNYLQNLNRYYGHSDPVKTPQIYAIEKLITYLREKSKLFMFIDIHGHNSPKSSFIFGNFCQHFHQILQNKTFVRILQVLNQGNFDSFQCQFSKRNMTVKQKYDQHSKQASARVFAYRGNSQEQNNHQTKNQTFVEHSYTLQVHPYVIQNLNTRRNLIRKQSKQMSNSYKNLPKAAMTVKKIDSFTVTNPPSGQEIIQQYKRMGQTTLIAIMELIGVNVSARIQQNQDGLAIRKRTFKQLSKLVQFYQRSRKYKSKEINKQILQRYCQKWNILDGYKQFLNQNLQISQSLKSKSKICPIHDIYEQWAFRKQKIDEANAKRVKYMQKQLKEKQKEKQKGQQKISTSFEQINQNQVASQQEKHINQQQQQEQEKITFISCSKRNPNIECDNKKMNILKTVQFQLVQKIQKEQTKIRDKYQLMSFNNPGRCSSPQKRALNSRVTDISQLQKKIRKIIFRHKTQSQIADCDDQITKRNKSPFQIPHHSSQQRNFEPDSFKNNDKLGYLKQLQKQYLGSKLEPLTKQKVSKLIHIKTQQNRYERDFNDKKIIDSMENKGQISEKRTKTIDQSSNPRIQEFMRKITKHKLQLETIMYESNNQQIQVVKSKQLNEMINRQKKSISRGKQKKESESRNKILHGSQSSKNQAIFQSNMILPPMYPLVTQQEAMSYSDNTILLQGGRLTGCHKSVKSKLKKFDVIKNKPTQQEIQEIVKSFRVIAGQSTNRLEFVQRAKKILSQKKRDFKTMEEHNLPTISELQYRGSLSRKTKY